jgi:hypothetical protein
MTKQLSFERMTFVGKKIQCIADANTSLCFPVVVHLCLWKLENNKVECLYVISHGNMLHFPAK